MDMGKFFDFHAKLQEQALANSGWLPALFSDFDVLHAAAAAGGLLTLPELQGNAVRLQAIAHLSVSSAVGRRTPSNTDAARWFKETGKVLGGMEDPAEDLFVTRAMFRGRNYLVLDGTAEASGYHLQRTLDVLEDMPDFSSFRRLKDSCAALLRLSDAICRRAGLHAYDQGNVHGQDTYPASKLPTLKALRQRVTFDAIELETLGIEPSHLSPFQLPQHERVVGLGLSENTVLERKPILRFKDRFVVALPSAIGLAIRFAAIAFCKDTPNEEILRSNLLATEIDVLSGLPAIHRLDISRAAIDNGARILPTTPVEFQPGYWFQVIIVTDDYTGFDETGFYRPSPNGSAISKALEETLHSTSRFYQAQDGYKLGLSLVVICGCGRSIEIGFSPPEHWIVETITGYDMQVLGWREDFDIPELFKFLVAENHAMQLGFPLMSVNGLLARAGFAFENDGHVIPHDQIPDGLEAATLIIPTNAQLILRVQHHQHRDWRAIADPMGHSRLSYARNGSRAHRSKYGGLYLSSEDARAGQYRSTWLGGRSKWLAETVSPNEETSHLYPVFEMQMTWLERLAPVLSREITGLPDVIAWRLVAPYVKPQRDAIEAPSAAAIFSSIEGQCDALTATITTILDETFFHGLYNEENISEAALVQVFIEQLCKLVPESPLPSQSLFAEIVPSKRARQLHAFAAQDLRDHVRDSVERPLVQISRFDNAAVRLGLGWVGQVRRSGVINGIAECNDTLNQITKEAEAAFCEVLSAFERNSVIERVLENHEVAILDRRRWDRTAGSLLDISLDAEKAREEIFDRAARTNATGMACRVILEAAICECPVGSGYKLADNDLSDLLARAMMIHQLGGYSDAIRYEGMRPEIRISPAGDVHIDTGFFDGVVTPVGRSFANLTLERNMRDYSDLLREPTLAPSDLSSIVDPRFLVAWEAELGISLPNFRTALEELENHFYVLGRAWASIKRTELIELLGRSISEPERFIEALELSPRDGWKEVPHPYNDQDRQPWRFKRRLSVVRKPLIRVSKADDSDMFIAPGIVRDAFGILLHSFYHGEIDIGSLSSKEMRGWREHIVAHKSKEFEERVVKRMEGLGWRARRGVRFSNILGYSLPKDPGDIDVLAWHPDGRIMLLECKDLQFAKTPSEIAKQLHKFRGLTDEKGRPDLLAKHLQRVRLAREYSDAFGKHLNVDVAALDGGLVFANPVPMTFAAERIAQDVSLTTYEDLETVFG